jgi:predicted dehydrogenase
MEKIKIGVMGAGRGEMMMRFCEHAENAKLVAVCDWSEVFLKKVQNQLHDDSITFYTSFDEFIQHDMDAVVLANYATEHAPYAIRCLKAGKHVFSEVLPCETLAEAVQLVEAVEASDKIYAYGENYCFMPAPHEMHRLYQEGKLGEFEYGEGEYLHNCESIWPEITQGNPDHWRNNMTASFYCTHSVGPLLHISGLRPVSVVGFELPFDARCGRIGMKCGMAALELITLENGAVIKSVHGSAPSRCSIWYTVYGSKGRLESAREDAQAGDISRIYTNLDAYEGENAARVETYEPKDALTETSLAYGHGGSDYYTMWNFVEKIRGNEKAEVIDVYEALDMSLPGLLGYRSILQGNKPMKVPNFRHAAEREFYRNDWACTNPQKAGSQYIPSYSKGVPSVSKEVYDRMAAAWQKELAEQEKEAQKEEAAAK